MARRGAVASMSDFAAALRDAFGADRVRRERAARAVHDVQGRRPGRLAGRDAQTATRSSRALTLAHAARRAGDAARRRLERAGRGRRRARPGDPAARRRRSHAIDETHVRADAAVTINGLVRWTINHGCAGLEAWAGTPGTVGGAIFGNAHFGGRLIGELVDERAARVDATARVTTWPRPTWRSATIAAGCRRTGEVLLSAAFRVSPRRPGGAARDRARVAGVPQAHAAARHAERRLHLPEPGAGARRGAGRHSVVGRRAGRSRRAEGRRGRRRARLADARQLHRQRRRARRRADIRALIERCRRAVRERFGVELREEIVYLGEF